jgi:hypothetical protein
MKMKAANGVMVEFYDEGDPAIPKLDSDRVIKFRDERTRDQRAVDVMYLLASHGITLHPYRPHHNLLTTEICNLGDEVVAEIQDLKPVLVARLLAAGRASFYRARMSALGWSSERINDAISLAEYEIITHITTDHVTIVSAKNWDNGRIVHRCETIDDGGAGERVDGSGNTQRE